MDILKCGCGGRRKKKGCKGPNCPKPESTPQEVPVQSAQESQQN